MEQEHHEMVLEGGHWVCPICKRRIMLLNSDMIILEIGNPKASHSSGPPLSDIWKKAIEKLDFDW